MEDIDHRLLFFQHIATTLTPVPRCLHSPKNNAHTTNDSQLQKLSMAELSVCPATPPAPTCPRSIALYVKTEMYPHAQSRGTQQVSVYLVSRA